jgi:Leucine-rich repeat (LRR) protein
MYTLMLCGAGTLKKHLETASKTGALNLSDMKLKKVHDKVLQLSNLRTLDLSKNALTDIPEQLGSMAGMKQFNVSYNDIPQLPLAVWSLPLPALFACFAGSIWCRLNLPARAAVCGVEEL